MIAIDELRPMLGCHGDDKIQSPIVDSMVTSEVVFERAYCQYAKCGTSRFSLMTGRRPDSIRIFSNKSTDVGNLRTQHPTIDSIARWLKRARYHTQSFGKIYHDGWDHSDDWSTDCFPCRDREILDITNEQNVSATTIITKRLQRLFKLPVAEP